MSEISMNIRKLTNSDMKISELELTEDEDEDEDVFSKAVTLSPFEKYLFFHQNKSSHIV
jgi:hypothetical protein